MTTGNYKYARAAVVWSLVLWGFCTTPIWADEISIGAGSQTITMPSADRSHGIGPGDSSEGAQGDSTDKRKTVADQWIGGANSMGFGNFVSPLGGNQILSDASLFGTGFTSVGSTLPWDGAGRVDHSHSLAGAAGRFQHTTFVANGWHATFGSFTPTTLTSLADSEADDLPDRGAASHFESQLGYSNAFSGGNFRTWIDTLWHDPSPTCIALGATVGACEDSNRRGWGIGSTIGYMGFELVGYFHDSKSLALNSRISHSALWSNAGGSVVGRKADGYFVQGSYALNGKTKLGLSYSADYLEASGRPGIAASVADQRVARQLWTVGVYHDVSSWLRLMAEYNRGELSTQSTHKDANANAISVGTFLYW